jgi:hypothetical protein
MYMVLANPTQYVSSFTHHITPTLLHRIASHPHCRIYTTPTPPHHTASHPLRSTASHHIKSHHITSHHITSQRIASHHITLSLPHLYHSRSTTPHCISPIILAHPRCHIASHPHTRLNTIPAPPHHTALHLTHIFGTSTLPHRITSSYPPKHHTRSTTTQSHLTHLCSSPLCS